MTLPKIYPTREAAARAWLTTAKKTGEAVVLGGGWWVVKYTYPLSGMTSRKRLQGLHSLSRWLEGRGILRALPDGTMERLS